MLDSLREAGVENFTMKAAVPGTEVPGHEVSSAIRTVGCRMLQDLSSLLHNLDSLKKTSARANVATLFFFFVFFLSLV